MAARAFGETFAGKHSEGASHVLQLPPTLLEGILNSWDAEHFDTARREVSY